MNLGIMNKFTSYLSLMRLMYHLGLPFEDRMSMKEFEVYAEKMQQSAKKASF
jgi:hypothetical protein